MRLEPQIGQKREANGENRAVDALSWWGRAAEQGHAKAPFNLGVACYRGEGVPQDYVLAHMWLNLAVSQLSPGEDRDQAESARDKVARQMTPAQITEVQRLAREWKPKKQWSPTWTSPAPPAS